MARISRPEIIAADFEPRRKTVIFSQTATSAYESVHLMLDAAQQPASGRFSTPKRCSQPEAKFMQAQANYDRCLAFLNCQAQSTTATRTDGKSAPRPRAITISRQAGCGALVVAEKLARLLQTLSPGAAPWTVFDRNLMEKVLEDHHLPARLAKYLPEDRKTELQDIMDELFGLRPASWTVIEQTAETILRLAELGNVVLIGRGATVITAKLSNVFHVRLVAPLEMRIEHAQRFYNMTKTEARNFCIRQDRGRKRYLKKYFQTDVEDPLLYHIVINTGMISYDDAARIIADAALATASK